jgi:hypothetical protein
MLNVTIGQITPPSWRIGTRITNALNTCIIFDLFDDAIANMLCVKTYTHGTSPRNYHNIMKFGADPKYGGGNNGECAYEKVMGRSQDRTASFYGKGSGWNCKNRFFVCLPNATLFMRYNLANTYCGKACIGERYTKETFWKNPNRCATIASIIGCCSPTVKLKLALIAL